MQVETENKEIGHIFSENEYFISNFNSYLLQILYSFRCMLMRHWSLYDSMYYSNYISPKLGTWKDYGKKQLQDFLTKLGIPLAEAN